MWVFKGSNSMQSEQMTTATKKKNPESQLKLSEELQKFKYAIKSEGEFRLDVQAPLRVCIRPEDGVFSPLQLLPSPHPNRLFPPPLPSPALRPWSGSCLHHAPELLGTSLLMLL